MLNSKENLDPKGILKNTGDKRGAVEDSVNLTMSDADARTNRRVSFAPEVTLHKIDLIPQHRRQTIGHTSSVSSVDVYSSVYLGGLLESGRDSTSSEQIPSVAGGFGEVLPRPVSDLLEVSLPPPAGSQLVHSPVHDTSGAPVAPVLEQLSHILSSDDEGGLSSSEEMEFTEPVKPLVLVDDDTMEFTQQLPVIKQSEPPREDIMEFTQQLPAIKQVITQVEPPREDTMEFTQQLPLMKQSEPPREDTMEFTQQLPVIKQSEPPREDTMEFTLQLPAIKQVITQVEPPREDTMDFTQQLPLLSREPADDETMEFTQQFPAPKQLDHSMEFTQPLPVLKANKQSGTSESHGPTEEERIMELNQLSNATTNGASLSTISEGDEEKMEMTQPVSNIQSAKDLEVLEATNDFEMETTQVVSTIKSIEKPTTTPSVPNPPSQASSTVTTPKKTVSQSPYSKQATPQFPDVEIPIPTDLSSKRFSDMDDEQVFKSQKLTETSTVHKIPLADVSTDSIDYPNYQSVTLSQFLNDLGIKFFDDIELDDVSNQDLNNQLVEQEYEFNDYIRANSKLLVYSLFEFSNKDLSRNIVEGRKLYQELNDSIVDNNPDLFKDFYNSTFDEQESLKADFSLIQEYCKYKARNTWYTWRIQLMENLIEKLNAKYESLIDDKQRIEKNIKLIDQEFNEKIKVLNGLKVKSSLIVKLKAKFDEHPDEFEKVKTQLSNSKEEMIKIKIQVENQQEELALVVKNLNEVNSKIEGLNFEIKKQQVFIENNKKFSINDIKVLNFNNKLLQEMSGVKFIEKIENCAIFEYKGFKMTISKQVSVESITKTLFNEWISKFISYSTYKIEAGNIVDKTKAAKAIIDKYIKLDREMFKISVKLPLQKLDTGLEQLAFKVVFFKNNEFKINLTFTSSLQSFVAEDVFKFKLSYQVVKSVTPIESSDILRELINECHVSNEILTNVVL